MLASSIVSGKSFLVVSGRAIDNRPPEMVRIPNISGGIINLYCAGTTLP